MEVREPLLGHPQSSPPPGGYGSSPPPGPAMPQYKGEVPDEDVEESAAGSGPPAASAPPLSDMDHISGYDYVAVDSGGASYIPPPSYAEATAPQPHTSSTQPDVPTISEDEAREALLDLVSSNCCYGKGAARELIFTNIIPSSAFHYKLETYTEGRKTSWEYEPFTGQLIDGPMNGPAPLPWSITTQPTQMFHNHEKYFEVPHTASVKVCHNCLGNGAKRCWRCMGRGRVICGNCHGRGRLVSHHHHHHHDHHHHHHHHHHNHHVMCYHCGGSGRKSCWTCHGCGQVPCEVCLSRGQLKCYIKLTVSWKTHKLEHVVERTALPDDLIKQAQGVVAFQDQHIRVAPVTEFPDSDVNSASARLVQTHSTAFPTERILMQRHQVRVVPVAQAHCSWKADTFTYFVYGQDNRVYAPDYPQKCCCGCTLL